MSHSDIKIDSSIWITQQQLADELKTSVQRVHNWVKRNKISSKYIKDLRITLVDKTSINIKTVINQ